MLLHAPNNQRKKKLVQPNYSWKQKNKTEKNAHKTNRTFVPRSSEWALFVRFIVSCNRSISVTLPALLIVNYFQRSVDDSWAGVEITAAAAACVTPLSLACLTCLMARERRKFFFFAFVWLAMASEHWQPGR